MCIFVYYINYICRCSYCFLNQHSHGYGSPIDTFLVGYSHPQIPAILMWTTGVQGFDTLPHHHHDTLIRSQLLDALERVVHGKAAHAIREGHAVAPTAIDFADVAFGEHLPPSKKTTEKMGVTRPGKHTKSYWKWPFIVDFSMKNGDFP